MANSEGNLDVFSYDLPQGLRNQIVHIIRDAVGTRFDGSYSIDDSEEFYKVIHGILCREHKLLVIGDPNQYYEIRLINYFLTQTKIDYVVDVIELFFRFISGGINQYYDSRQYHGQCKITSADAIEELNERFKENSIGYQFSNGLLVKVDSTYIHSEITKPTLVFLSHKRFKGANEEYLKAHEHYRHGRNKECITECLKAFESTLKTICEEKAWAYNHTDTAKKLIQICFANNLVPSYSQNQFTSLVSLIESGIPTIRNKVGGHGQGQSPQAVDDGLTRYAMNLTGSNIIFLIEQSGF